MYNRHSLYICVCLKKIMLFAYNLAVLCLLSMLPFHTHSQSVMWLEKAINKGLTLQQSNICAVICDVMLVLELKLTMFKSTVAAGNKYNSMDS